MGLAVRYMYTYNPGTRVMYPLKAVRPTLTDWTAFPLDVQPLLWGTVQIRTAGLKVHPVTFYITILKRLKNKVFYEFTS